MSYSGREVQALRALVWEAYPRICCHCKRKLKFSTFTVEHLLPRSKGGSNELPNLRPACGSRRSGGCGTNYARGNRAMPAAQTENQLDFFS